MGFNFLYLLVTACIVFVEIKQICVGKLSIIDDFEHLVKEKRESLWSKCNWVLFFLIENANMYLCNIEK